MKKKILLMMAAALCAGEVSLAAVPLDSAALGGITSGMTQEDIESIYGPADVLIPYELNRREGGYVSKLSYGNTVVIWMGGASASSTPKVEIIVVSADNGFATPEGIHGVHKGRSYSSLWTAGLRLQQSRKYHCSRKSCENTDVQDHRRQASYGFYAGKWGGQRNPRLLKSEICGR